MHSSSGYRVCRRSLSLFPPPLSLYLPYVSRITLVLPCVIIFSTTGSASKFRSWRFRVRVTRVYVGICVCRGRARVSATGCTGVAFRGGTPAGNMNHINIPFRWGAKLFPYLVSPALCSLPFFTLFLASFFTSRSLFYPVSCTRS